MSSGEYRTPDQLPDDNPKTVFGMLKPALGLVPKAALEACAAAMKFGADKYGRWNWRQKTITTSVYVDAIGRHWADYKEGKNVADDSGISQLGHIMASCAILLDAEANGCLVDDRPGRSAEVPQTHSPAELAEIEACKAIANGIRTPGETPPR